MGEIPPPAGRPPRRLILCCDGSWQSSNHGQKNISSNVAKLSRSIANYGIARNGDVIQQIVYYDAGVGTGTSSSSDEGNWMAAIQKRWEGGFGRGLEENVCEGYNFLVNNWLPGDEIYIFGFSRGAYTARALAGLICNMGICFPDMMDDWWAMYENYRTRHKTPKPPKPPSNAIDGISKISTWSSYASATVDYHGHFYKNVPIEVVGVFDTVGALGLPNNNWVDVKGRNNDKYGFHDTDVHEQIKNAFHALALDEHRKAFEPTLWHLPRGNKRTNLIQCWFPGFHINVGGGSDHTAKHYGDLESMASLSLAWMIDLVRQRTNLVFEDYALTRLYNNYTCTILDLSRRSFKKSDSSYHYSYQKTEDGVRNEVPDPNNKTAYAGFGMGYRPDSMDWVMKMAGSATRTPGQYKQEKRDSNDNNNNEGEEKQTQGKTNEFIHPVVTYALSKAYKDANGKTILSYAPKALDGFKRVKDPADPKNPGSVKRGIFWEKVIKPERPEDHSYARRGWDYAKSFIWTPDVPAGAEEVIIHIQEMALWEDSDENIPNERDYIRADWLAVKAPKLGFPLAVEQDIDEYLDTVGNGYVETEREKQLLKNLEEAAPLQTSSIWQGKSLVFKLRRRVSPDVYKREQLEGMFATGERTREFLAKLDRGEVSE